MICYKFLIQSTEDKIKTKNSKWYFM